MGELLTGRLDDKCGRRGAVQRNATSLWTGEGKIGKWDVKGMMQGVYDVAMDIEGVSNIIVFDTGK